MKKITSLLVGLGWILSFSTQAQIHFTNQIQNIGIQSFKTEYSIGNGVSFVDFDGDGLDDLTIGTQSKKFIEFYKNEGGSFKRIIPPLVSHRDDAKQVLWIDYDNDGDLDLFVASVGGRNRLYQNQGDLKLQEVTEAAGLPLNEEFTYGATWADYDRDGWLDLYYGNHENVVPDKYNKLFRNRGDGTFQDVSSASGADDLNKIPYCSAFFDFNNDQWPDIYTANDKLTYNTLLLNLRNGKFEDVGTYAKAELKMNGMCVAIGDYDNNGWQDIYITNTPVGNKLLKNTGQLNSQYVVEFEEVAESEGLGYYGHGWASNFFDADNDGDLDLYVNGTAKIKSQNNRTSILYENELGHFTVPECGMAGDSSLSYVNVIGDINNDGFPDIFVQNNPPGLHHCWINDANEKNWLKIQLQGVLSNRDALGAKIEVYSDSLYQMRYRHSGIGFLGQNSNTEIIGLDSRTQVDSIIVTWPTGHIDRWYDQAAKQTLSLVEGSSNDGDIQIDPALIGVITSNRKEERRISPIHIFPNPASQYLQVDMPGHESYAYQIFCAKGQLIQKGTLSGGQQVPIVGLVPGWYTLKLSQHGLSKAVLPFTKI